MAKPIRTYKDLIVWQKSVVLAREIYKTTAIFPKSELYGLTSQIRRCSVSIASNIAEGFARKSNADYNRFLLISMGSLFELETQLIISREVGYLNDKKFAVLENQIDEVERMLSALQRKVAS